MSKTIMALIASVMLSLCAFALPNAAHAEGLNALTAKSVNAWKAAGHTEAEARRMQVGDCFEVKLQSGTYRDCLRHPGDTVWNRTRVNHGKEQALAKQQGLVLEHFAGAPASIKESFTVAMRQMIGAETRATTAHQRRPAADTNIASTESDTEDETGGRAERKAPPVFLLALIGIILAWIFASLMWGIIRAARKSPAVIRTGDRTPFLDPRQPPPPRSD